MLSEAQWEALDFWAEEETSSATVDTESVLSTMWSILRDQPKLIEHALNILDNDPKYCAVKRYTDSTNRHFYTVRGEDDDENVCFESFCSCPGFAQLSCGHEMKIMCKHLLATRIARALKIAECVHSSLEQVGSLLTARGIKNFNP